MTLVFAELQDTPLRDICIPGTHDSGSYAIRGIYKNAGRTTKWTLKEQLEGGYRYLDLRIAWRKGSFHMVHGICTSALAEEGLSDIGRFARDHPREIVLVKFVPIGLDSSQRQRLTRKLILPHVGDRMLGPMGNNVTFKDFWEKDKNILFAWCGKDFDQFSELYWHKESLIVEHWSNTDNVLFLVEDQVRSFIKLQRDGRFHVAQLVMTPGLRSFFLHGLSIQDLTYRELDQASLILLLAREGRDRGKHPNIMMVDFPEQQNAFGACMEVLRLAGFHP